MRLWMICYDIADDEVRQQVSKLLEYVGDRVQYSVFECWLSPAEMRWLSQQIALHLVIGTDSIRYYPLCSWCQDKVAWQGRGRKPEDPACIIV